MEGWDGPWAATRIRRSYSAANNGIVLQQTPKMMSVLSADVMLDISRYGGTLSMVSILLIKTCMHEIEGADPLAYYCRSLLTRKLSHLNAGCGVISSLNQTSFLPVAWSS